MAGKLFVKKKCRVAMITFGGLQRFWAKRGDIYFYDKIVEWNSGFVITAAGLNRYIFQRQGVTLRCPKKGRGLR